MSTWDHFSLERIPDAERHQLDEILFTPAWDDVSITRLISRSDKRSTSGKRILLARLKFNVSDMQGPPPRIFQGKQHMQIRADVLNRPYLVQFPWCILRNPPHCVRLLEAILDPDGAQSAAAAQQKEPSADGIGQMRIVAPQSLLLPPAVLCSDDYAAGVELIARAVEHLSPRQRQRLADGLFMQTAAMHLFQMHSALPEDDLTSQITSDRILMDELVAAGALIDRDRHDLGNAPAAGGPSAPSDTMRAEDGGASDAVSGWREDYRSILKLSTVFPLRLQRHHTGLQEDRPGLSSALLQRWTAGGSALCQGGATARRASGGLLQRSVNLTQYRDWEELPLAMRADVQPLCMHPRTLAEAVVQLRSVGNTRCILMQWGDLKPLLLGASLAKSCAALCCCVNDALMSWLVEGADGSRGSGRLCAASSGDAARH